MRKILLTIPVLIASCSLAPPDMFPEWDSLGQFSRDWYSSQLHAAKEEPIELPAKTDIFRLTWLRSFHSPIIIHLECPSHCTLAYKVLSNTDGQRPGKVSESASRQLSSAEQEKLYTLFNNFDFWTDSPSEKAQGLDGAQWILEAARGESYAAWDVWTPERKPQFAEYVALCDYLVSLTGLDIPDHEYY